MTNPYKIIFDPDLWPAAVQSSKEATAQSQPSQESITPQNHLPTPILIPDPQMIQNNSPAIIRFAKKDQLEEDFKLKQVSNKSLQNSYIQDGVSKQDIAQIIEEKIANLRVYVLESDITQAQNSIKSVVGLASF